MKVCRNIHPCFHLPAATISLQDADTSLVIQTKKELTGWLVDFIEGTERRKTYTGTHLHSLCQSNAASRLHGLAQAIVRCGDAAVFADPGEKIQDIGKISIMERSLMIASSCSIHPGRNSGASHMQ